MKHGRRLDPPQLAVLASSVAVPCVGGIVWMAVCTDWLRVFGAWVCGVWRHVADGVAWVAGQFEEIDWSVAGDILLALAGVCLFFCLLGLSVMGVRVLCHWRLSLAETIRAALSVMAGVACMVAFCLGSAACLASDPIFIKVVLMFAEGLIVLVYGITLILCILCENPDPSDWRVLLLAPRAYRAYRTLIRRRLAHNGIDFSNASPGYDRLFADSPERLAANREQLCVLADYCPGLTEWLRERGVDAGKGA